MANTYPLESLFGRVLSPFEQFLKHSSAGGIVLIAATLLTLGLANSPWSEGFHHFWEQPIGLFYGTAFRLEMSLHHWVNDGLMALFFLLVGLELKREVLVGELSSLRDAALPVIAAAGGMLMPALLYTAFNGSSAGVNGWGIPTATDIAFAIGILVLLGKRAPRNLIVFLTALAIADDLGAVLVIALFYTSDLNQTALAGAALTLLGLGLLNRAGVRRAAPYWALGLVLWYLVLLSGIHATLAGILLALTIPAMPAYSPRHFEQRIEGLLGEFRQQTSLDDAGPLSNHRMAVVAANMEHASIAVQSPLQHTEHGLSPWVTFLIVPVFALANAGVDFRQLDLVASLGERITLGVILGLVLGKFVGISLFSWLGVKLGLGRLPNGVTWRHILGAAWLGGIGFTMSLFIGQLAFRDPIMVDQAKVGILLGSLIAAVVGTLWLLLIAPRPVEKA
ncbi:Na+/H+ antiporter NhaA [Chitinimonas lacunae]|uniref:Na(+)/H(+) antiporter NhaA n=1 Tax=Chitinimonas lacunae TaxID=1963018 RepID=A0ABV8MUV4_9NEIS